MKTWMIVAIAVVVIIVVVVLVKQKQAAAATLPAGAAAGGAMVTQPDSYKPDMSGPPVNTNAGSALGLLPNVLPGVQNKACQSACLARFPFNATKRKECQAACGL